MSSYSYTYLMEYLPVRYSATLEQQSVRQTVFNFKDGICSRGVKLEIVERIKLIRQCVNEANWRICFIPASSHLKTVLRYKALSDFIQMSTGIPCSIDTINTLDDEVSGHIGGKKIDPAKNFFVLGDDVLGKNVILIDDVITRGNTFVGTADKLIAKGAKNVVGLFLAKTINPDYVSCSA